MTPRHLLPGLLAATLVAATLPASAQTEAGDPSLRRKRPPDLQEVRYGPRERNLLDLWQAPAPSPTPLLLYVHGGGFRGGDRRSLPAPLLHYCLEAGISVAALNYTLSGEAPFPAPMHDCARALQFLRAHAAEWNLDPGRVASSGGSAGAGISLWLAFHDDLADPESEDPVARQSTRLLCAMVWGAQTSYDPRFIQEHIGGPAARHPALQAFYGLTPEEEGTEKAFALYREASPIEHLSADDPPVFLYYTEPDRDLPPDAKPGAGIHHPRFGKVLAARMEPLGPECVVRLRTHYAPRELPEEPWYREMISFFRKQIDRTRAPDEEK